jgi:hypothetical protein
VRESVWAKFDQPVDERQIQIQGEEIKKSLFLCLFLEEPLSVDRLLQAFVLGA